MIKQSKNKKRITVILFAITILFLLSTQVWATEQTSTLRRFGLYVGANYGGSDRVTLRYAITDAQAVDRVMQEMGGIMMMDKITLKDPSVAELDQSFEKMKEKVLEAKTDSQRTEFFFYYSGHSDETGLLLGDQVFSYPELRNKVQQVEADVNIAILDSCSSGSFTRMKGGSRQSPFLLDESVKTKGHAFLTSSSENEAAQESDRIGASFFTHYLVSALRGAADNSGDGKVTLHEAYSYASNETLSHTTNTQAGPQHPAYDINLSGSGDLVLTDLRISSAAIVIKEEIDGRMFIYDNDGRLVAELRKNAGMAMTVALPPGKYKITLETVNGLQEAEISLTGYRKELLTQPLFSSKKRELTRARGGDIEPQLEHVYMSVDFIPEWPLQDANVVRHDFSMHVIGNSYRIEGVEMGVMNFVTENVHGFQYSYVGNIVGRDVKGFQLSNVFNITDGNIEGGQLSGVFNISNGNVSFFQGSGVFNLAGANVEGFQGAGVFNLNGGDLEGFQGSGVFNHNEGNIEGFQGAGVYNLNMGYANAFLGAGVFNLNWRDSAGYQGAGVFNINKGWLNGAQTAGVFNISGPLNGAQIAGVFNIADDVDGAQIGVVNFGKNINGTQIGVININKDLHGVPIGLLNISKEGIHSLSGWSDERGYSYVGFQIGTRNFYNLFYTGKNLNQEEDSFTTGLGLGFHFDLEPFYVEADVSAKQIVYNDELAAGDLIHLVGSKDRTFPSARAIVGFELFNRISIFGGVSLEGHLPTITQKNDVFHTGNSFTWKFPDLNGEVEIFPRWFAGVRL